MRLAHHHPRLVTTSAGRREHGYVMVMFGLLIVPIILMAGLAVDVGSWYNESSNIQKAADAAALAGVVWLPDVTSATTYAKTTATKNGYTNGVNGVTVTVVQVGDRQLRVTITDPAVGSFFYKNLGGSNITLSRKGTAEYVLPIPLGSPENRLGNDPLASPVYTTNLWASISAPYTDKANGDPYSTKCDIGVSGTTCTPRNTEYRDYGYLYVIDVPASEVLSFLREKLGG